MEIFEKEPYTSRFQAKALEILASKGRTEIRLDSTAFFPSGGGQGCDVGTLSGKNKTARVTETYEKGGLIWHACEGEKFEAGEQVSGEIDWPRRYAMMKSHTGEHTFFHALSDVFSGVQMDKVQIAPEGSSIFVRYGGELSLEGILEAEKKTNSIIAEGLAVTVNNYAKANVPPGTRVKIERIGSDSVRVVRVGEFDSCACAGIHVRNTAEIGAMAITGVTSEGAGAWKLSFLIGQSAIVHLLQTKLAASKASLALQTTPDKLERTALNLKRQKESLESSARGMAESILSKLEPEKLGEFELCSGSFSSFENKKLMEKAGELIKREKAVALFSNIDGEKGFLLLAKSQNLNVDLKAIASKAFGAMNGKGGGKENFITGAGEAGKLGEAFSLAEKELRKALAA